MVSFLELKTGWNKENIAIRSKDRQCETLDLWIPTTEGECIYHLLYVRIAEELSFSEEANFGSSSSSSSVYFPSKYHNDSFYNTEKGNGIKHLIKNKFITLLVVFKHHTGSVLTKSRIALLACDSDVAFVIDLGAAFQIWTDG